MIPAAIALFAAFAVLAWLVQSGGPLVTLDGAVQAALARLRSRRLLLAFDWLTQFGTGGTGAAIGLAASALLWSTGHAALVAPFWLAFIGAEATTWSIKFLSRRVRPPFLEGLTAGSPSFPSAHATVSISVFGYLALTVAAARPAATLPVLATAALLILLIGFSRLLLSLHYLTDVIGGFLIGAAWLLLSWHWVQAL